MNNSNTINWSIIIPAITLIVSIVSPVLVCIINNIHNTKIHKMDLNFQNKTSYIQKQQEVFDSFLKYTSKRINKYCTSSVVEEYTRLYNVVFLYTPSKYWKEFQKLDGMIASTNTIVLEKQLNCVAMILAEILRESDRKHPK